MILRHDRRPPISGAHLDNLPMQLADLLIRLEGAEAPQDELHREAPEGRDHFGLDDADLSFKERRVQVDLRLQRVPIIGRGGP